MVGPFTLEQLEAVASNKWSSRELSTLGKVIYTMNEQNPGLL